ncbi:unnamed protein product [Periconia digitata]|uniref:Enoyl reductase (ER) domain-containing protein n=1 Tax=Periconia digitata TaxID=1303443 RepID=A0A9W4UVD9_9PLEO|nr:unnamed protein product [Periconia digitata]
MQAIKVVEPGKAAVVNDEPIPALPTEEWILVKTVAVALNPTDWKHIRSHCPTRSTPGCDIAGVVEKVGSGVTRDIKKGDRVFGFVHGCHVEELERGAFQEYVLMRGDLAMKIPDGKSFEELAGSGVAVVTIGQGLYQEMGLPWPEHHFSEGEKPLILIWGGSSGMGAIGIQFAKLSGFRVLTTCSPSNYDYVKSLGADVTFNSRDPNVGAQIREYTKNKLYYAWDCIGEHGSIEQCANALASEAPEGQEIRYGTIVFAGPRSPRDDVIFTESLGYTAGGYAFKVVKDGQDRKFPARPDHLEWMLKWTPVAEKLLSEGKWTPQKAEVREGGLEGILGGLDDLMNGKVSGVKLTYRIADP